MLPHYNVEDVTRIEECGFQISYNIEVEYGEIFEQWFTTQDSFFVAEVPDTATPAQLEISINVDFSGEFIQASTTKTFKLTLIQEIVE